MDWKVFDDPEKSLIHAHFFVENDLRILFVAKTTNFFFCNENNLHTLSGKVLLVEIGHPESSDFLGFWEWADLRLQC